VHHGEFPAEGKGQAEGVLERGMARDRKIRGAENVGHDTVSLPVPGALRQPGLKTRDGLLHYCMCGPPALR
jgi:hypothetical protein